MGMQVNTNLAANNAYRNLNSTQNALSKSMEKLSSGLRINRAADDAAGLAISEGLKSQVNGYTVAARNAQDGISVIQTAEGALTEVHSILQRMRDLAVQAGNDSNNSDSRAAIMKETDQLSQELTRISGATNFNGTKLLDGSANLSFQIGAGSDSSNQIKVDLTSANVSGIADTLKGGASSSIVDVVTPTAVTGAQQFGITNADGSTSDVSATLGAAGTYKSVQDVATALNGQKSFSDSLTASVNEDNQLVVSAKNGGTVTTGTIAAPGAAGTGLALGVAGTGSGMDLSSATGAAAAIAAIDTQIKAVSDARANIGAVQNRFESAINSLNVGKENLTAASSRITDVDMASEMVSFTRSNILSQAGTAMLAQANQSNQGVLKLLG
ncbi:flagellin [Bacillus sp. SRB_336]|nr:flagellin [Bacillus sp. SRB_336]